MLKTENIQNIYRLSPMQEGLLFHSLYEKGSLSYFMRVVYYFQGDIDPDLAHKTLTILFQRHEILRTVFNVTKAKFPLQVTLKQWEPEFTFENISYLSPEQRNEYVQAFKQKDLNRGFDLTKDRLLRLALLQTGRKEFAFILSHHHIILDGWSWNVLMEEYNKIYDSLKNRKPYQLATPIPYFKYIQFIEKQDKEADHAFWKQYVSDYNQVALIPKSKLNPQQAYSLKRIEYYIPPEKTKQLVELTHGAVVTLSTAIRVIWGILLAKYNNNRDVIFGAVVSGRPSSIDRVETMVGLFINTLPVRIRYNESTTFSELLHNAQQDFLEADIHSYSSVAEIQALSELKNQLMDHVLTFANFPSPYELEQKSQEEHMPGSDSLKILGFEVFDQTNYDFSLTVIPGPRINIVFAFNEHVYEYNDMVKLGQRLEYIVDQVIAKPDIRIDELEIILREERMELQKLNNTTSSYLSDKTLQELFEQQVKLHPDKPAVVFEQTTLTYSALNEQANKLAHHLRKAYNIQPNHPVGIMLSRSEKVLVSILAILKAGGCYVFIDPSYPEERLRYITSNAEVQCLILESTDMFKISFIEKPMFAIDVELDLLENDVDDPVLISKPDDLAYIIYTSGSTGKPKGVTISHRALLNTQCWRKKFYGFDETFMTLQFASFSFDSSVNDVFSMLLWGGSLLLLGESDRLRIERINELLATYSITNFNVVPGLYRSLVNDLKNTRNLKLITLAGERLTADLVNKHFSRFENIPIINEYGPTENAICSTAQKIDQAIETDPSIGRPIDNTEVYILDHCMQLLPPGLTGEMYLSGDGLSNGYVQNDELTTSRFLPNPFHAGKKIYRTGDLGRWNAAGELEYLGRADEQVKIRGYRVEPGEIESVLLQHEGVTEAAVIVKNDPPVLIAYYSADGEITNEGLLSYLSLQLPDYMIPVSVTRLDKIPVTSNGKIDRKLLLEMAEKAEHASDTPNDQPQTAEEKLLADIWKEVLGKKAIGIQDNFFKTGGDSIKAIQIASRCFKAGYKLDVKDIFEHISIEKLAKVIKPLAKITNQEAIKGIFPLTPIQERFFASDLIDKHHYNQSVMLSSQERLKAVMLKAVFAKLMEHHDMLRATYDINSSGITQQIKSETMSLWFREYDLYYTENAQAIVRKHANDIQAGIDLEKGPLMKMALFHVKDVDLLLIVIHHLVMDTVSWRILLEDIEALYNKAKKQEAFSLPPKTDSFKKWAISLSEYASSNKFLRERRFWNALVDSATNTIHRDMDAADSNTLLDTDTIGFELSAGLTEKLIGDVHISFNTDINDILLLSLAKAVKEVWGLSNVMIDLEGHGRENILPDLNITRTVGWFTSVYPVSIPLNDEWEMERQIIEAKDALHRIPYKGIGFGILKYLSPAEYRGSVQQFNGSSISFNYLGQFDADIANTSFSLAGDNMGHSMSQQQGRQYELEINGMILGGELQMNIRYNRHHYKETTIQRFADAFKNAIGEVCTYCLSQSEPVLTSSDLTSKELSFEQLNALEDSYGAIEDVYPLTPSQEGLLFHYLRDKNSTAYFEQVSYRLEGALDAAMVEKSLQLLTERHAVLRTAFVHEDLDRPLQVLLRNRKVDFTFENIEALDSNAQETYVQEHKENDKKHAFDLANDPLFRVILLQLAENRFELIWSHHHIIMDGWCVVVISQEFWKLYNSLKYGKSHGLEPVHPYRNYIQWLQSRDSSESKAYWNKYISGYRELTGIPDRKLQSGNKYVSARVIYELDESQTQALNKLKEQYQVTLNTIVQAVWGILIGKYNYTEDVLFGAIVSGRPTEIAGIESIIGLFINMIPVRVRFQPNQSFADLLKQLQAEALESEPHHYYPLPDVQAAAELKQQLLDHFMVFTNYPEGSEIENVLGEQETDRSNNISISGVDVFEHTNYDFNLIIVPNKKLKIEISYNQAVFDELHIKKIAEHVNIIVGQITTNENIPISSISLLSDKDSANINEFNDTAHPYSAETLCHRFTQQAFTNPHAIAVTCGYNSLTYEELETNTSQLAGYIKHQFGIGKNDVVGVLLDRSPSMVVALLAVLRAGAAYLPLDPKLPENRIRFMLEDSQCKLVIIQDEYRPIISFENVLDIHNYVPIETYHQLDNAYPHDLAYVIYTSGSTGKPKGVAVQHRALMNFLLSMQRRPGMLKTDSLLATTTYSFDISILEIFLPLITGARTIIAPQAILQDPYELQEMISAVQPTVMQGTPTFWEMLINCGWKGNDQLTILCGGEPLTRELAKKLLRCCRQLWNMYGPTETTVWSCIRQITPKTEIITVGKPIWNTRVYILDKDRQLLPAGFKGEIFIAGDGLAAGYVNQPRLTAEKYIPDPFRPGNLMYATGDLGSWTDEGDIICYGRNDEQVKIRGHRIELGEIESCLMENPSIEKAVVVARKNETGNYLAAYYTATEALDKLALNRMLMDKLPPYMIPEYLVQLDSFAVTPAGKIDKKLLPEPGNLSITSSKYAEPVNEIEKGLVQILEGVLDIKNIGRFDNFFELGGHSIKAIQAVSRIKLHLKAPVKLNDFFKYPRINELAAFIETLNETEYVISHKLQATSQKQETSLEA